jgi:hypothetical protein
MANLVANNPKISGEFTEDALAQLKELEDEAAFELLALDELEKELGESTSGGVNFPEYNEDAANDVKYVECPSCGHKFPK